MSGRPKRYVAWCYDPSRLKIIALMVILKINFLGFMKIATSSFLSMHKDLGSGGFNLKKAWIMILASALLFVSIAGISMATTPVNSTGATPVSYINSTGAYFGCVSKDNFTAMVQYMVEKNETAFNKAMTAGLSAGTTVVFNNSESVYVMDHDYSVGLIQVRPNGDKQLYWTVHEAVPSSWK